jgi:DMSO/TMAO reductase YedYZ molybdopterin-dependent catalytic subunit
VIGENDYSLDDLVGMGDEVRATIDCTGGWYSTQDWSGVRLDRLVEPGEWRSIEVVSATGYARRYPVGDLDRLWLAVAVGGDPLSVGHGYPARIVAPDRRGFWWVKWVVTIRPSRTPWWLQSPFPLT